MILKELDPFLGGSQDEIAHRIAQDRMAYHLRRYFGKSEEVDVLNYLCAIANRLDIDLEEAFRSKNARNQRRSWS